jgi:hypothetical protein
MDCNFLSIPLSLALDHTLDVIFSFYSYTIINHLILLIPKFASVHQYGYSEDFVFPNQCLISKQL